MGQGERGAAAARAHKRGRRREWRASRWDCARCLGAEAAAAAAPSLAPRRMERRECCFSREFNASNFLPPQPPDVGQNRK